MGKTVVVGITGGTGSGKTTFAERLLARLGEDAVAFSHDDYYKNMPGMTLEEAKVYDFDSPDALETGILVEHLRALASGQPVDAPSYDFASHTRTEAARHVDPVPVILVEGMLIMCDPELLDLFDLMVFMDVDPDVRVLRRIVRDCRDRGADLERAVAMYLNTAKPAHEKYVEPFKPRADIIATDALGEHDLEVVLARIDELRASAGDG